MSTVSPIADRFQAALKLAVTCGCGYTRLRTEGACPSCRADRELADALAALRALDDYDAARAAAAAVWAVVADAPVWRSARRWEPSAVKQVRDPELPRGGRDDD